MPLERARLSNSSPIDIFSDESLEEIEALHISPRDIRVRKRDQGVATRMHLMAGRNDLLVAVGLVLFKTKASFCYS